MIWAALCFCGLTAISSGLAVAQVAAQAPVPQSDPQTLPPALAVDAPPSLAVDAPPALAVDAPPSLAVDAPSTAPPKAETSPPFAPPAKHALPVAQADRGLGRTVVVIPITGTIDLGLSPFVARVLDEHRDAALIVLNVDTFGGRVDAAVKIRDALLATKVPVLAFVNRRAISAGALISLAAHHLVVTSGATIGAATPIQLEGNEAKDAGEKMVSYMRSEMRSTAEARGRSGLIAEAMVDADIEVPGFDEKGKLLTLTTESALATNIADAEIETLPELLNAVGLEAADLVEPTPNWAENVARFLTDPVVSGLLMGLGMLGLFIEFSHPGFVLPGVVGAACLVAFFGGHYIVELAGLEELLMFLVGLLLLGIELFVIPGFGLVGMLGIGFILFALVLSLLGLPLSVSWDSGLVAEAFGGVMLSIVIAVFLFFIALRFLPKRRFARGLVLETTLGKAAVADDADSADWHSSPTQWSRFLGHSGVAATDLRLAGKATIDGQLVDVVSFAKYIDAGTPVRVIEVEGVRIVVTRVIADTEGSST